MSLKKGSLIFFIISSLVFLIFYSSLNYINSKIVSRMVDVPFNLSARCRVYQKEDKGGMDFSDLIDMEKDKNLIVISSTDSPKTYAIYDPNYKTGQDYFPDLDGMFNFSGGHFTPDDYLQKRDFSILVSSSGSDIRNMDDDKVKLIVYKNHRLYREDINRYLNLSHYGKLGDKVYIDSNYKKDLDKLAEKLEANGYKEVTEMPKAYGYLPIAIFGSGRFFSLLTPIFALYLLAGMGLYNLSLYNKKRIVLRLHANKSKIKTFFCENSYLFALNALGFFLAYLAYIYNKNALVYPSSLAFAFSIYAIHLVLVGLISLIVFELVIVRARKDNYSLGGEISEK